MPVTFNTETGRYGLDDGGIIIAADNGAVWFAKGVGTAPSQEKLKELYEEQEARCTEPRPKP